MFLYLNRNMKNMEKQHAQNKSYNLQFAFETRCNANGCSPSHMTMKYDYN